MNCPNCNCGAEVPAHVERCIVCGADVGFPNVRAAQENAEVTALELRVNGARVTAVARGTLAVLESFGKAVKASQAIIARPLGDLDALAKSNSALYISFHSQVRAGARGARRQRLG